MPARLLRILAWALLAAIAVITLAPIGFRPITGAPPAFERFAAFALISFCFALAYPRRPVLIAALVAVAAVGLEGLQALSPTRHARWLDMDVKLIGAVVGLLAGIAIARLLRRRV